MRLPATFFENGSPKDGLSPLIYVWNVTDDTVDVNGAAATAGALTGTYYYEFSEDPTKEYTYRFDSVTLTGRERYAEGAINSILPMTIEGSLSLVEVLRIILAVLAGKGEGDSEVVRFRDQADSKDRVILAVNTSGDRSSVTLDGS